VSKSYARGISIFSESYARQIWQWTKSYIREILKCQKFHFLRGQMKYFLTEILILHPKKKANCFRPPSATDFFFLTSIGFFKPQNLAFVEIENPPNLTPVRFEKPLNLTPACWGEVKKKNWGLSEKRGPIFFSGLRPENKGVQKISKQVVFG